MYISRSPCPGKARRGRCKEHGKTITLPRGSWKNHGVLEEPFGSRKKIKNERNWVKSTKTTLVGHLLSKMSCLQAPSNFDWLGTWQLCARTKYKDGSFLAFDVHLSQRNCLRLTSKTKTIMLIYFDIVHQLCGKA